MPLWPIAAQHSGLFQRLTLDTLAESHSIYGFFPQAYDLVYGQKQPAGISFDGRNRGRVAILQSDTGSLVIKPMQSQREDEIAAIAGTLGIGPRQFPSLPGFLTEEFIEGQFFTELTPQQVSPNLVHRVGRSLGSMLFQLHQYQIYYNDATLSDPDGRSHLLVDPDGDCRLIDFGVSLLIDRHPRFTQEEVYNFVRTMPEFQLFTGMSPDDNDVTGFLSQYQQRLAQTPKEHILARDLRFMEEGLKMAADRMGEHIVEPLQRGFHETYRNG